MNGARRCNKEYAKARSHISAQDRYRASLDEVAVIAPTWAVAAWLGVGTLGLMMPIAIAATSAAMNGMSLRVITRLPSAERCHPKGL